MFKKEMKRVICLIITFLGLVACSGPKDLMSLESHYVDYDGATVHYKVYGDGPRTITFIHGFGCDINCWEHQFQEFRKEKDFRLVFVDLPGYGQSGKPADKEYTLQYFAGAACTVLDTLHSAPSVLVGHSLGTPVCRQIMLSSAYGLSMLDIDGVYCFYGDEPDPEYQGQIDAFASSFDGDDCKDVITGFAQSLAGPDTPQNILDYSLALMPETPQYIVSSTMHNLVEKKWWNNAIVFPHPVSVICTQNSGLDEDNKEKMEALYSDLNYIELETCGHFIQLEQPGLVNDAIRQLIDRTRQCALEDFDFAVSQIENNYAGFELKTTGREAEWEEVKKSLREVVESGSEYPSAVISDLCAWFQDFHLSSSFRYDSQRYPRNRKLYMNLMDWYAPEPTSARVDKDTWLIRVPTWSGDDRYVSWVSSAIDEYKASGCENLIIDERSNGGGSDWQYKALLNLLYLQDGKDDGMLMRNSKENRDRTREIVGGDEFWTGLMDKCEQHSDSAFVQLFETSAIEGSVDPRRPKKTAVIIDNQVASSAEQFLLDVRSVAPDVMFIGQDNTLGCIDVSNVRPARLPHYPNSIAIPTTISYRIFEGRTIDGKGISPDIVIDLPLPDTLSNNVDSWTVWAAERIKLD